MKLAVSALALAAAAGLASAQQTYNDTTGDVFANSNLDITQVQVSNDATNLYISVQTASYQNWTKYLFFFDTQAGGTDDNPWGPRPIDLNGRQIDRYIGSWVDAPNSNAQMWSFGGSGWNLDMTGSNDQSQIGSNIVRFTIPLAFLGVSVGQTFAFDVATSGGGGNDPGVDHLSRSDQATSDWSVPSQAGNFLSYTVVPAPGAAALLGIGALAAGRRRR